MRERKSIFPKRNEEEERKEKKAISAQRESERLRSRTHLSVPLFTIL